MTTIPYYPLDEAALRTIVELQLARVQDQMHSQHAIALRFDEDVVTWIVGRCDENDSGARLVDAVIAQRLLPEIGQAMLARQTSGTRIERVEVTVADDAIRCTFF
jgi:type VI secretion system protein VasG